MIDIITEIANILATRPNQVPRAVTDLELSQALSIPIREVQRLAAEKVNNQELSINRTINHTTYSLL